MTLEYSARTHIGNKLLKLLKLTSEINIDWYNLSYNPNITWEIVEANPTKPWNWNWLSGHRNITWEIVKANPENHGPGFIYHTIQI